MSAKEVKRVFVMEQVLSGKLTVRQAAQLLGLSERQVKRLKGGMQKEGVAFLAHKNRGRKPGHAVPKSVCDKADYLLERRV
ncbi:helix-turn-helix domain-containing protein [Desulfofundulus salinus]|uniref:helix-turn-helix domain-containing protein n=1 Tax=Desulfofundulus salinus TaxID=2419843 RepID=UPI001A9B7BA9|nr:helix-turn-helix domain-containing protein [Desulfofundulus salinum]